MQESHRAEPLNILLLDGESGITLRVAIALSREPGMRIYAISSQRWPLTKASFKIAKVFHCPFADDRASLDFLRKIVARYEIGILIACTLPGIGFVARNSAAVSSFVRHAAVPTPEQLAVANDKWRTAVALERLRILAPPTVPLSSAASTLGFPLLVKPRVGAGGEGIVKIEDRQGLSNVLARFGERREDYIAQSFLAGPDVGCSVLCRNGKILASTVQRPMNNARVSFAPPHDVTVELIADVLELAGRLAAELGWNGVANFDFRRSPDGAVQVLEINARYWASLMASLHAGVNFPHLAIRDACEESFAVPQYARTDCYGIAEWRRRSWSIGILPLPPLTRLKLSDPFPVLWLKSRQFFPIFTRRIGVK